jgi:hypothetical protein
VDPCTRRAFMRGGALSVLGIGLGGVPRFLVRTATAQGTPSRSKVLIAVFQRGAVDGLSMVVPHGDPDYYSARGAIAIARPAGGQPDTTVDLDGFFGLHPCHVAAQAPVGRAAPRRRARMRVARHHALALRRAGLHGVGDARGEEHRRRLARPRAPCDPARERVALPRGGHGPSAPARAAGRGGGGGDGQPRRLRREGRAGRADRRGGRAARLRVHVRAGRARSPLRHGPGNRSRRSRC